MDEAKVIQAAEHALDCIDNRIDGIMTETQKDHLRFMLDHIPGMYRLNAEKAMRWLGFVQGALWLSGLSTIEEMKKVNR